MYVTPVERLLHAIEQVTEVPVATLVPTRPPSLFIRLDAGSSRASTVTTDETLIAVQVYGKDQDEVIDTLGFMRFFLLDEVYVRNRKIVWWDEESGPHEFPDPDGTDFFRWQLTGNLTTTLT